MVLILSQGSGCRCHCHIAHGEIELPTRCSTIVGRFRLWVLLIYRPSVNRRAAMVDAYLVLHRCHLRHDLLLHIVVPSGTTYIQVALHIWVRYAIPSRAKISLPILSLVRSPLLL